jgi:hypothetical protein
MCHLCGWLKLFLKNVRWEKIKIQKRWLLGRLSDGSFVPLLYVYFCRSFLLCRLLGLQVTFFDLRLEKILGDDAYGGVFAQKVAEKGFVFEKASRPESVKGFVPIAKRWVVERTIAWTNFFRRIVKDYEYSTLSSETWIILANLTIVIQRIFL